MVKRKTLFPGPSRKSAHATSSGFSAMSLGLPTVSKSAAAPTTSTERTLSPVRPNAASCSSASSGIVNEKPGFKVRRQSRGRTGSCIAPDVATTSRNPFAPGSGNGSIASSDENAIMPLPIQTFFWRQTRYLFCFNLLCIN